MSPPQPPLPAPPLQPHDNYPPMTVILTVVLLIVFFIGFFSVYFCRCFMHNFFPSNTRQSPTGTPVASAVAGAGLDPLIVQSFPTFTYSSVREYRKEKYGLECAICLIEFDDSDALRLLTACCHVFHQGCIDAWLESHKTCPVCRQNLESESPSPTAQSPGGEVQTIAGAVSITIRDDGGQRASTCGSSGCKMEKFSRSHSTGHSITEDRFTLRLPEHVKTHIIKGGHNCSMSWGTFGEFNETNFAASDVRSSRFGEPAREEQD